MEIVTGYKGTPHISSDDIQGFQHGIIQADNAALNVGEVFRSELASNNELKVYDGEGVIQGVHFRVLPNTYDSISLQNGTQGKKRKDLIVIRYTKNTSTSIESVEWAVKKGTETTDTPTAPAAVTGDIRSGDKTAEFPWFEVEYNGISVVGVVPVFEVVKGLKELQVEDRVIEVGVTTTQGLSSKVWEGELRWEKWASGKMVYYGYSKQKENATITKASWANGYEQTEGAFTLWGTYPIAFVGKPPAVAMTFVGADTGYTGDVMFIYSAPANHLTWTPSFKMWRGTTATIGHPQMSFTAIGRWK